MTSSSSQEISSMPMTPQELVEQWRTEAASYPTTQEGEHAAAAVRCCANELEAILASSSSREGELREQLEKVQAEASELRTELLYLATREYDDNPGRAFDNRRKLAKTIARHLNKTIARHLNVKEAEAAAMKEAATDHGATGGQIIAWLVNHLRQRAETAEAALTSASLVPSPQMDGWRPIETAPKDGTHVLLWCVDEQGDGIEAVGAWFSGWTNPMTSMRLREDEPTHWMPLPSSPGAAAPMATRFIPKRACEGAQTLCLFDDKERQCPHEQCGAVIVFPHVPTLEETVEAFKVGCELPGAAAREGRGQAELTRPTGSTAPTVRS